MKSLLGPFEKRFGDRLAVAVVEQNLIAALGEAGVLRVHRLFEAGFIGFESKSPRKQRGVRRYGLRVGGIERAHALEVLLDAGLFEAGLVEILRGSDKDAGAAFDGRAQGAEVAAGFGRQKQNYLLGLLRDGDENTFTLHAAVPRLDAGKPAVGGRVRRAAQERRNQEIFDRLGWRKVWVQPELIASLEIRHFRDGEGDSVARDPDFNLWTGEIEAGRIGVQGRRTEKQEG